MDEGQATGPAADPDPLTTHAGHLALEVLSCASSALKPAGGLKDTQTLSLFFKACDLNNESSYAQPQLIFQLFDTLRQVAARAPNFAPAHSMLASSIVSVAAALPGDHSALLAEARNEANLARRLDPTDPDAAVAIENLAPAGDWSGRLAALGPALDAHPDAGFANGSMGVLLAEMGYLDEGAAYLQKAAAADPFSDDYLTEEAKRSNGGGQTEQRAEYVVHTGRAADARTELRLVGFRTGVEPVGGGLGPGVEGDRHGRNRRVGSGPTRSARCAT